jgi:hypothetical protein
LWYYIPRAETAKFEKAFIKYVYGKTKKCGAPLRHKIGLLTMDFFAANKIAYKSIIQHPGQFIITYDHVYHAGFNYGFNCNEAVNFGFNSWSTKLDSVVVCNCQTEDGVRFSPEEIKKCKTYKSNENYHLDKSSYEILPDEAINELRSLTWNNEILNQIDNVDNTVQSKPIDKQVNEISDLPVAIESHILEENLTIFDEEQFDNNKKSSHTENFEILKKQMIEMLKKVKQFRVIHQRTTIMLKEKGYKLELKCSNTRNCKGKWMIIWLLAENKDPTQQKVTITQTASCEHRGFEPYQHTKNKTKSQK